MPTVVCNTSHKCGHMNCQFYRPKLDCEIEDAYCKHWGGKVAILEISRIANMLDGKPNPNLEFIRKKNGL